MSNEKQKILIVGAGGGREHAIGWKIAQPARSEGGSFLKRELFFARGNAGTAELGINLDIKETEIQKLIDFAQKEKVDLTLALSDDPLALGIVDEFQKAGLRIWGPSKAASQLEWSKAFSKEFMRKNNLPTAKFEVFNDFEKAKEYIKRQALPVVIKADGLALGKGVTICDSIEKAEKTLEEIMVRKIFGDSGNEVIIEEFLIGPEISIHAFSDGKNYKMFPASQDHKKIREGDVGPNTGGVGTITPLPFVSEELMTKIEKEIVAPTLEAMAREGKPYVGVLYPGLILTQEGPKILEYNARFGDPETQVYVRILKNDLLEIIDASIDGKLNEINVEWEKDLAVCNIVLCSGGYPGSYEKGKIITGVDSPLEEYPRSGGGGQNFSTPSLRATPQEGNEIIVFHAGTKIIDTTINGLPAKALAAAGGRVLGVSATAKTLPDALLKAYKAIEKISFEGMQYRKDIGKKALSLSK